MVKNGGLAGGKITRGQPTWKRQFIIQTEHNSGAWGRGKWAGLGLCGLNQTGRTLSTYRGSCDTIHSVFLVLFWLGMDLEKHKKDGGATDMHVWNFTWSGFGPACKLGQGTLVLGQKISNCVWERVCGNKKCGRIQWWSQQVDINTLRG